ncbi:response regulator [Roseateles saccharophilus]|uniref:LuxR family two component transcriptional regulator n=1 Tax=Roseateles saccharophilus TaxID=304 RepID=A0A4R3UJ50_ROSSA|nr:response regulator transcription factor [Roseateles saccharophilus]MDG0834607.1 response regulator transcription factor [Roseateles saccharophilus]TCU89034.1 LuxR family two component transcriptional regulator [Roseateles saccharophilus]
MSRIYLIDDHAIMRDGLRLVLEAAGHEVVGEAADPTPALADLARLRPDVVLLDLRLGQRSGFELLAEFQRRGLKLRVIVLTMSDQPRHVAEALRLGACGYLLKGSAGSELLQAVEAVAAGRRFLSPQAAEFAASAPASAEPHADEDALSPREHQILLMVAQGQTSNAIGEALHLSPKSVDTYRSRLMKKLGLHDIAAVVKWAIREGLISLDED